MFKNSSHKFFALAGLATLCAFAAAGCSSTPSGGGAMAGTPTDMKAGAPPFQNYKQSSTDVNPVSAARDAVKKDPSHFAMPSQPARRD